MKFLIGMMLLSTIAIASPISYKEKGEMKQQVEAKKKKKKKGCGCGGLCEMQKSKRSIEVL